MVILKEANHTQTESNENQWNGFTFGASVCLQLKIVCNKSIKINSSVTITNF